MATLEAAKWQALRRAVLSALDQRQREGRYDETEEELRAFIFDRDRQPVQRRCLIEFEDDE